MSANPEAEWFGYRRVGPEEKTARVKDVFSSVADRYDLMNDLMSCGLHRLWKDHFVARMRPRPGEDIFDIAGGTGDIAMRMARAVGKIKSKKKTPPITVCDINPDMLRVGREKALNEGFLDDIAWVTGNAETLPFKDKVADLVCISFGLRNVTRIDAALSEFARILRPGGRFFCMEFSPGVIAPLRDVYDLYSFTLLPWLGDKVAQDRAAYQYLAESIRKFPDQETLSARMKQAGFTQITHENLMGGIAVIHSGWIL